MKDKFYPPQATNMGYSASTKIADTNNVSSAKVPISKRGKLLSEILLRGVIRAQNRLKVNAKKEELANYPVVRCISRKMRQKQRLS